MVKGLIKPEYMAEAKVLSAEIKASARAPEVMPEKAVRGRKAEFKTQARMSRG